MVPNSTPSMDGHQDTMDPQLDTNPTTNLTKVPTKDTGKERKRPSKFCCVVSPGVERSARSARSSDAERQPLPCLVRSLVPDRWVWT